MGPVSSDELNRYLKQTRDLYGDELFIELDLPLAKESSSEVNSLSKQSDFASNLKSFHKDIQNCQKCSLGQSRTNFVFGVGDPKASLLLVGGSPDEEDDSKGKPFQGESGVLLDKILAAIDRSRKKGVYICNIIKCKPPGNRDPNTEEVAQCVPYLFHQINLIKPKLIVALGRVAGMTLLKVDKQLKSMRGVLHDYHEIPLIVTYHPAALIKNHNWKPETWKDFKWIRSILDA